MDTVVLPIDRQWIGAIFPTVGSMGVLDFITDAFSSKKKQPSGNAEAGSKGNVKTISAGGETLLVAKPQDGKRKKAASVTAECNEEALGFSISLEHSDSRKRAALRISLPGLELYIHRLKKKFPATDISATGIGFSFEKPRIKGGVELMADIVHEGQVMAKNVTCKVMHHEQGTVGCRFVELDRSQDDAVNKLVLIGQKLQAERRKHSAKAELEPTKL